MLTWPHARATDFEFPFASINHHTVCMCLFLEVIARIFADLNCRNRAEYLKWRRINTTKDVKFGFLLV